MSRVVVLQTPDELAADLTVEGCRELRVALEQVDEGRGLEAVAAPLPVRDHGRGAAHASDDLHLTEVRARLEGRDVDLVAVLVGDAHPEGPLHDDVERVAGRPRLVDDLLRREAHLARDAGEGRQLVGRQRLERVHS